MAATHVIHLKEIFLGAALLVLAGCASTAPTPFGVPPTAAANRLEPATDTEQLKNLPTAELLERGGDYLATGNLAIARLHFLAAGRKDPGALPAYLGLGEILFREGDYAGSEAIHRSALEREPGHAAALAGVGRALREQRRPAEAARYLGQALEANPGDPAILTELAITYDGLGKTEMAEPLYLRVVELFPGSAAARNNLGMNLILQERYEEAAEHFGQAVDLQPEQPRYRNNLALAEALAGRSPLALRLFRQTIGSAGAYNNIGYLHLVKGEWRQAEWAFGRALEENPRFYPRAHENLQAARDRREQVN